MIRYDNEYFNDAIDKKYKITHNLEYNIHNDRILHKN